MKRLSTQFDARPDSNEPWTFVASHTHHLRSKELDLDTTNHNLVEWCCKHRVDAVGVGSPWEPVSSAHYAQYEGPDRDTYYSGDFDQQSVKDEEHIEQLFTDLNTIGQDKAFFYQDNETPKCRYGHIWWFGWDYDYPAWHDYSQNRGIQYYDGDPETEINAITGQPHRRRPYMEIVAAQRAKGALAVWAHPTSWWWEGESFITNIAAECHLHLLADGFLDGFVNMGYDAYHPHYQALWYHLLDTGAIVPGFGETDNCHNESKLLEQIKIHKNGFRIDGELTKEAITETARTGRSMSTTGPVAIIDVDGVPMGSVCRTKSSDTHTLTILAWPAEGESVFSRLEIIGKGGKVLAREDHFTGGQLTFEFQGQDDAGYVVVRAFGEHDDPDTMSQKKIRHHVITNPVYLHPKSYTYRPVTTETTLSFADDSPWIGGTCRLENADGSLIESSDITAGVRTESLPASARVTLQNGDANRQFYIAMENLQVQKLLAYLWQGGFRDDHPETVPGYVPPQAWDINAMANALSNFSITL